MGYFVWKITILCQKIIFFPNFRGGAPPPPWIRPCITPLKWYIKHRQDILNLGKYSFSIYCIACFIYFFWMENIKKKNTHTIVALRREPGWDSGTGHWHQTARLTPLICLFPNTIFNVSKFTVTDKRPGVLHVC